MKEKGYKARTRKQGLFEIVLKEYPLVGQGEYFSDIREKEEIKSTVKLSSDIF